MPTSGSKPWTRRRLQSGRKLRDGSKRASGSKRGRGSQTPDGRKPPRGSKTSLTREQEKEGNVLDMDKGVVNRGMFEAQALW
ncbi:hypothetical protein CALCODRAFT_77698 [Calocera cornea HHB12733]|uniref:Uncharacterized protein n=1 Tax=Calocera cornea HHB12733 TaxID=1353952 RepID=A0A165DGU7_9BASI|nr:hypothetical protein CALCODRAFT_77698 [Calocera cornea HHB12733]